MTRANRPYRSRPDRDEEGRKLALQLMLAARLDSLLDELGVAHLRSPKMFSGPCPVHGGSKPDGFAIYREGESLPGYWQCWTRGCHEAFAPTILGFVRGVLSRERHGWEYLPDRQFRAAQRTAGFRETIDWCLNFLGVKWDDIKVDDEEMEKRRFAAGVTRLTARPEYSKGIPRKDVRSFLQVPSPYFLTRGYTREILERYDVGEYPAAGRPLSGRAVVPVFDEEGKRAVGFTGRSLHEQCTSCSRWHASGVACPSKEDHEAYGKSAKWFNQGLNKNHHLYNWDSARTAIAESGVAVIVEGPGDVWRLEEAGVANGLGLFGSQLSERQQVLLDQSGAMTVAVLTDADEAGGAAKEQMKKRLFRSFRVAFPPLPEGKKDVGSMSVAEIKDSLLPALGKLSRRW